MPIGSYYFETIRSNIRVPSKREFNIGEHHERNGGIASEVLKNFKLAPCIPFLCQICTKNTHCYIRFMKVKHTTLTRDSVQR